MNPPDAPQPLPSGPPPPPTATTRTVDWSAASIARLAGPFGGRSTGSPIGGGRPRKTWGNPDVFRYWRRYASTFGASGITALTVFMTVEERNARATSREGP